MIKKKLTFIQLGSGYSYWPACRVLRTTQQLSLFLSGHIASCFNELSLVCQISQLRLWCNAIQQTHCSHVKCPVEISCGILCQLAAYIVRIKIKQTRKDNNPNLKGLKSFYTAGESFVSHPHMQGFGIMDIFCKKVSFKGSAKIIASKSFKNKEQHHNYSQRGSCYLYPWIGKLF